MLPASATTALAVPDRPAAERPEPQGPDASDGRFAGLMAQFVQVRRDPQPPADQGQEASRSRSRTEASPESGSSRPEAAEPQSQPTAAKDGPEAPSDAPAQTGSPAGPSATEEAAAATAPAIPTAQLPLPLASAPPVPAGATAPEALTEPLSRPVFPEAPLVSSPAQPGREPLLTDPGPATQAVLAANLAHPLSRKAGAGLPAAGHPDPVTTLLDPASRRLTPQVGALPPDAATHLAPAAKPLDRPSVESIPALQTAVPGGEDTLAPAPAPTLMGIEAEPLPLEAQAFKGPGPLPFVQGHPGATAGAALTANQVPLPAQPVQATTPVPAMPAPAPPPPPAVAQVDGGLRWMLRGGAQEARLQLHPESLGQVTIHLKVEGGEVHARLWITEPASVQAVQEGRPHLEQSLKEQGLQLGSFDLQQGQRPFQEAPSAPLFRGQADLPAQAARQEAPAPPPPSILNTHHVELYA